MAADPRIDQAEPQGLRRGDEVTVKLSGPRLGVSPEELVFYEPGVELVEIKADTNNAAVAKLKVADNCPLGHHAVRLRTASGLSNLITLHVGVLESLNETEPNNTLDAAQPIATDRTVQGVVTAGDEDLFAVEVIKGQRVSVEVEGLRLGRTFFDPLIELLDESGDVLAANDDQTPAYADPFLTYIAKSDGKLLIRVRESAYRGDAKASYLLHVGDFPRPPAVYPAAAKRGGETEVAWIGADPAKQTITVAEDAGAVFDAYASDDRGVAPTAIPVWVADEEPALEVEPNNKRDLATAVPCPGVATGVIREAADMDHFRITAAKKQAYDLRVRARELRSPLDAVLRVYDTKGKRLAGNDDDRGTPDSYLRFVAPADGEYILQVEDRLKRGGEAFTYVLDVARPKPVAEIKLDERRRYEATVLDVPRGGRTAALLTVSRRGFGGEVALSFDDLPPGVTVESFPLAANYNRVPVVLTAGEDAELAASLSPVTVAHTATDKPPIESRFEQQTWLVRGRNNRPVWSHFADRAAVAITEPLPFKLSLSQPKAPLCLGGSIELQVNAERDEGFDQAVAVRMLYHSPGVSSNRSRSITKGESQATIPVTANAKASVGGWPIVVVGETNLNGRVYVSTQFVTLKVAEPFFDLALPTNTGKQGESVEWAAKLSPRTGFEGAAKLELVGLPPGVKAEPVEVEAGAESAAFQLTIAPDAKPGRHRGVGCQVRLEVEGEPVTYRQAYAELRIDPAEAPPERTAALPGTEKGSAK